MAFALAFCFLRMLRLAVDFELDDFRCDADELFCCGDDRLIGCDPDGLFWACWVDDRVVRRSAPAIFGAVGALLDILGFLGWGGGA